MKNLIRMAALAVPFSRAPALSFTKALALSLSLALAQPAAANTADDEVLGLIRGAADKVLARVTELRTDLEAHPELMHDKVADLVLPYFDFPAMTASAMGRFWPRADEAQRTAVIAEFQELLIRTYGSAVFKYSGKPIEYDAVKWSSDGKRAMVPTKVEPVSGPAVPIDYKLHQADGSWKVYDVVIDNISLVTNYRSSFANEIRTGGVDGLIAKLRARNEELGG